MKRFNFFKKNDEKDKNMAFKKIAIVLSVLIGIAIIVIYGAYVNVTEVRKQMQQNLSDVAHQNSMLLNSKLHAKHELITALSNELEGVTEDNIQENLSHYKILLDDLSLKRFAFCFPDGTTYSTDGEITDLVYREFFQKGMDGKCCITGVLSDAIQEKHDPVNVMTIPLFDDTGNVTGVFGLAYDSSIFNNVLSMDSFDGKGFSCIVNENGDIVASKGNDALKVSDNLLDDVLSANSKNESAISDLSASFSQNIEKNGNFYLNGNYFYSCVPVSLMDGSITWHILTIIPDEVLSERISPILKTQYITSFFIVILVIIGALFIIVFMKEQHNRMVHFAYEDPLTHGNNYAKFNIELNNMTDCNGYLIDMSIANFNNISIVAGHEARDTMIKETWRIIINSVKKGDHACHVHDDSFLLFLSETDENALLERMHKISEQISKKARDFKVYGIQAGYGIYAMTKSEPLDKAYSKARIAKEFAKANSNLYYAFYAEVDRIQMQNQKQLEERFPTALKRREFEVWYQPKYSASDCRIVGSEALVRWRNPDGTMISPGEFIPLFEKNGMIMELDEYMFDTVCRQQKKWLSEGKNILPVSINLSRASLYSADVHKRYSQILKDNEIEPRYIQLEITESVMKKGADIRGLLNKFRQMGIKILMDDFGTGYSSFATLSTKCFDTLKLDKSLIDHIGNRDGETMLYHIIRMGQQMGLHITAEGVEHKNQLTFLQNLKCDDIQGFYFSRPLPMPEYEDKLMSNTI